MQGCEATVRTQGEIEAAFCDAIRRFEQEYMGRGPKDIHAYLIDDIVFVRLQGGSNRCQQHLVESQPPEKGRDLLKEVRKHLLESEAAYGGDGQGNQGHRGRVHASRYQHRDWRGGSALHLGRGPASPRNEIKIAGVLTGLDGSQGRKQISTILTSPSVPTTFADSR
jgi:hypothetical protein